MEREDVIASIEQQLREQGVFDLAHSITARVVNGNYQIVAGHHRVTAAKRAGLKQVPTWVREMDDETAFMHLGCDYGDLKDFKRHASKALGKVRAVYPALKIRSKPGGFDLLPCPPAVLPVIAGRA